MKMNLLQTTLNKIEKDNREQGSVVFSLGEYGFKKSDWDKITEDLPNYIVWWEFEPVESDILIIFFKF